MNFKIFSICFITLAAAKLFVWLLKKNKKLWSLAFPYGIVLIAPLCFVVLLGVTAFVRNPDFRFVFQFVVAAFFIAMTILIGKEKIC